MTAFRCALDARAQLGECATWSVADNALWWVDIEGPTLNRFDPATGDNRAFAMPSAIGSFGLRAGGGVVAALRDGIWLVDASGRLERRLAAAPYDTTTHRFNDGRCDRSGRFFVGTLNERRDTANASLYRLEGDGSVHELFGGLTTSNGLAWSPDGRTMYHADTPTRTVRAFDFDVVTGTPSNPRVFAAFADETHRPDGATVDSEGHYWVAFYRGGRVVRIAPDGRIVAEHPVPAMCPTALAFGGPDLATLYVTTAREKRPAEELARLPQSGGIFAMDADVAGLPEPLYRG